MNRLIGLFQRKADNAYAQYIALRKKPLPEIGSSEWNENVMEGKLLLQQYKIWTQAAEILRKEELTR